MRFKLISKKLKVLFIILFIWLGMFATDLTISFFDGKPVFSIPVFHYKDGGSTVYVGLCYNYIKVKSFEDNHSYTIKQDNEEEIIINYYDNYSNFSVIRPWFFLLDSISGDLIENRYLEYNLNIYKSTEFKKKMLKGYTLIDEYTTDNSKRYVRLLDGLETNDYIIVYNDENGNIINYYKSSYLYSETLTKYSDINKNMDLDYVNNDDYIIDDNIYHFEKVISTKGYAVCDEYSNLFGIKKYVIEYKNDSLELIEVIRYFNTINKQEVKLTDYYEIPEIE